MSLAELLDEGIRRYEEKYPERALPRKSGESNTPGTNDSPVTAKDQIPTTAPLGTDSQL